MSRVIKFRMYDIETKYMSKGNSLKGIILNVQADTDFDWDDSLPIMQFTGLYDKNGAEIYESDLLQPSEPLQLTGKPSIGPKLKDFTKAYKVVYSEGAFKIQISNSKTKRLLNSVLIRESGLTIVGNIHQNPELIK